MLLLLVYGPHLEYSVVEGLHRHLECFFKPWYFTRSWWKYHEHINISAWRFSLLSHSGNIKRGNFFFTEYSRRTSEIPLLNGMTPHPIMCYHTQYIIFVFYIEISETKHCSYAISRCLFKKNPCNLYHHSLTFINIVGRETFY